MALTKVTYVDEETLIEAENLNDIQDHIIALETQTPKTAAMTQPVGIDSDGKLYVPPAGGQSAGDISYDPDESYPAGSVGADLTLQSQQIAALESSDIEHAFVHMGLYRDADGDLCEL